MFKKNDVIRNKNPYFGEATKRVLSIEDDQYHTAQGSGKYGLGTNVKCTHCMFSGQMDRYRLAGWIERGYLFCIGLMFFLIHKGRKNK